MSLPSQANPRQGASTFPLHPRCPLCSSEHLRHRFNVDAFDIDRCHSCTLTFVRQKLSYSDLESYYQSSDSVYEDPSNTTNLDYYFLRLKRLLDRQFPSGGRLLDVGCSRGQFLDLLQGWDAYGIELSASDAAFAQRRHGSRIHQGTLADYPSSGLRFDVITLQDSFDHMPDPYQVLHRCRSLLRPGGCLVIKVHDISCLYARRTGRNFYAILPPYHLFYYSEKTLLRLLEASGFQLLLSRHIGHRLFLKTIPYRLARGKASGFFYMLYKVLDKLPLGRVPVYKNLNDIITVLARRDDTPWPAPPAAGSAG